MAQSISQEAVAVTGLPGATTPARLAGGTTSGAPGSGNFIINDVIVDETGALWVCTASGSPGTWVKVGASTGPSGGLTPTTTQTGTTYTASASQLVVCAPTSSLVITLPTAPSNGTLVGAVNLPTATATVTFTTGGSDVLQTSSVMLYSNQSVVWNYDSTTSTWLLQISALSGEAQIQQVMGAL